MVRCRYKENIENGKIGSSTYAEKLLLYATDLAAEDPSLPLDDWQIILDNMRPNKSVPPLIRIFLSNLLFVAVHQIIII